MVIRVVVCGLAVMVLVPAALGANTASRQWLFAGMEVAPSCSRSALGNSEFEFIVVNRRETSVADVRLDVYFGSGTRLTDRPGFHQPGVPRMFIAGRHAWRSFDSVKVYSGFGVSPVVHGPQAGTRERVVFALTVEGVRHTFPVWACTPRDQPGPPQH